MKTVEEYALDLVASGAESHAEDDLNEDGRIADEDHQKACDLAIQLAHFIRRYCTTGYPHDAADAQDGQ